jgi:SAM-dependent methyltransferase
VDLVDGYPAFAPVLARQSNGYPADGHKEIAHLEDSCFWFKGRNKLLQFALNRYFPSAENLLEIGCGTGFVLAGLAGERPGMSLIAGDIYIAGLNFAHDRVPQAEFIQMDARYIPYVSEFDVIGAFDVLEHIDDDLCVLREIFKAVKPKGGCIISVPQHQWLWSSNDEIACHKRRYSRRELKTKMETVGFKVLWTTSFVTLLLPLMLLSRAKSGIGGGEHGRESALKELKLPAQLNTVLEKIGDLELAMLRKGISLPAGGSLLYVGEKE